jgi:hypothetical protein
MTREWIEVLSSPALTTALSALAALGGVALGSRLTTGRERWNAKRDAYAAVLEGLQQVRLAQRRMETFYATRLPLANAEALQNLQAEARAKLEPEFKEARLSLYRAAAVGRLMLNPRAVAELDRYEIEDAEAADTPGLFPSIAARRRAAETAMDRLIEIARDELEVGKLPMRTSRKT